MIDAFWNIRSLNKSSRLQCISDFIREHRLDFVSFQETKKSNISDTFLQAASKAMDWKTVPAKGATRGILVGVKKTFADIVS
jgi:exonuclease III